jgi:hypothetical protein
MSPPFASPRKFNVTFGLRGCCRSVRRAGCTR